MNQTRMILRVKKNRAMTGANNLENMKLIILVAILNIFRTEASAGERLRSAARYVAGLQDRRGGPRRRGGRWGGGRGCARNRGSVGSVAVFERCTRYPSGHRGYLGRPIEDRVPRDHELTNHCLIRRQTNIFSTLTFR